MYFTMIVYHSLIPILFFIFALSIMAKSMESKNNDDRRRIYNFTDPTNFTATDHVNASRFRNTIGSKQSHYVGLIIMYLVFTNQSSTDVYHLVGLQNKSLSGKASHPVKRNIKGIITAHGVFKILRFVCSRHISYDRIIVKCFMDCYYTAIIKL